MTTRQVYFLTGLAALACVLALSGIGVYSCGGKLSTAFALNGAALVTGLIGKTLLQFWKEPR